jgi:agmatine deiminase
MARLREQLGIQRLLGSARACSTTIPTGMSTILRGSWRRGLLLCLPLPVRDDPNATVYNDARHRAEAFGLKVVDLPSQGR